MSRKASRGGEKPLRSVGVDDGAFSPAWRHIPGAPKALLAVVIFDGYRLDDLRLGMIEVDGMDATQVLIRTLKGSRFDAILLSGVSFGGFNLIDAHALHRRFRKPVLVISGSKPDNLAVRRALRKHFPDWKARWRIIARLGRIYKFAPKPDEPPLYFEAVGIDARSAKRIIKELSVTSRLPEPIRVARLIARGLTLKRASRQMAGNRA